MSRKELALLGVAVLLAMSSAQEDTDSPSSTTFDFLSSTTSDPLYDQPTDEPGGNASESSSLFLRLNRLPLEEIRNISLNKALETMKNSANNDEHEGVLNEAAQIVCLEIVIRRDFEAEERKKIWIKLAMYALTGSRAYQEEVEFVEGVRECYRPLVEPRF